MSLDFRFIKYHLYGENNIIEYTWGSEGTERCMLACNKSGRGVVYVIQLGRWGEIQLICLIDVWTLCTFLKDFVFNWNLGGGINTTTLSLGLVHSEFKSLSSFGPWATVVSHDGVTKRGLMEHSDFIAVYRPMPADARFSQQLCATEMSTNSKRWEVWMRDL